MTLAAARKAKAELRASHNPFLARLQRQVEAARRDTAFKEIARNRHIENHGRWTKRHAADVLDSRERLVFPTVGRLPIETITTPMVLHVIRDIERGKARRPGPGAERCCWSILRFRRSQCGSKDTFWRVIGGRAGYER